MDTRIAPQMYAPPAGHPLHPYVLAVFRVRWDGAGLRETILPKGNVDILFNLGDPLRASGAVPVADEGSTWLAGVRTHRYVVRPQGRVDLLGVSLRAETCAALLPVAPGEIVDLEVHGPALPRDMQTLGERVREARTFAEQRDLLLRWLAGRLRPPRGAHTVRHACSLLRGSRHEDPVGATARAIAVSARHLRRMVRDHVGIGPAEYVRVTRFVRAMELMADRGRSLGQVAHAAGYYDQAHFCRDFRSFSHMTPQEYRGHAAGPVVGHLIASDGRSVQDASP